MKFNKKWHMAHPLLKNATLDQRIAWHLEHAKHCQCREIPNKLKIEIRKKNIKVD
jgi:hypothetical protein